MQEAPPIIISLSLDEVTTEFFNELRKQHFPSAINYIDAHLTLFHKLPAERTDLKEETRDLIAGFAPFNVEVTGLQNLGRGVAFRLASQELQQLHAALKRIWLPHLSPQDLQPFRPHITVQNKVTPGEARELLKMLEEEFTPLTSAAIGIELHSYLNGPWRLEEAIPFSRS
jgi:2'-5' RNA ligase